MKKEVKLVDGSTIQPMPSQIGSKRKSLISKEKDGSDHMSFKVGVIGAGIDIKETFESDVIHYMVKGKAHIQWNGREMELTDGMAIYIPSGIEIRYRAEEETDVISIWSPAIN